MAIYAIADLHLSFDERIDKPMDIFGERWGNYEEKIKESWLAQVTDEDTVIIAGDISWGLKLDEAMADLEWIHNLPGKKVLIKGNHDLWWSGIGKLNKLYDDITFLQNTYYEADGIAICGSRGWICPGTLDFDEADQKIYDREMLRIEMSLQAAKQAGYEDNIIAVLHFPPTNEHQQPSDITRMFEKYGVKQVVYGHLHGKDIWKRGLKGTLNGIRYDLISQDYLDGQLLKIR